MHQWACTHLLEMLDAPAWHTGSRAIRLGRTTLPVEKVKLTGERVRGPSSVGLVAQAYVKGREGWGEEMPPGSTFSTGQLSA